ncbi:T9SS type A sorting domain-containing protein [Seonamhaeicola sediminis]|uniref:T9SS type A sorting domain-containing protein n=1 Tax=Seonamhaeicola sediminis TaxID=2528206 RepID=A0A562YEF7_9FLAO|nr:T9SS type A sorting domain-containing protein [Seonamhaeicola sediminis]TWO32713.1 T9SS type A sorting domain-containing protein [Seonamhaeicola sediminis]
MNKIILFVVFTISLNNEAQNPSIVQKASGNWSALIKFDGFDPNDDQQSNADTDFVGNSNYALMETQKQTVTFADGITDEVYYFRARMGQSNPSTSFYFGLDVTGDLIGDVFIEANVKSQTPFVSFHIRDDSKSGISPSQTAWLNGTQNNELFLSSRDAIILDYAAGSDIDGGNSGEDFWIEFAFTEEILKAFVLNNFGLNINGNSIIALYAFTSTSQTSNGDVGGVNDSVSGELDKTWEELGVIIQGSLNNIASGVIVTPKVYNQVTEDTTPIITGTWGGRMLGDDTLSVTVNDTIYTESNGLLIEGLNWSLPIQNSELAYGTYDIVASVYRASNNQTVTDVTDSELFIVPSETNDSSVTSGNDGGLESNGSLAGLIAKRNFKRTKTGSISNKKDLQSIYKKNTQKLYSTSASKTTTNLKTTTSLEDYLPITGYKGTETAYISSPEDLLGITNATKIFSVDYYQDNARIAAIFATETSGSIYDHSKIICDRLNNSSLEDASTVSIGGHQIISTKLKRATGEIEYTLSFSIKKDDVANQLFSFWNIGEYPAGNYYNFQIWGGSYLQLFSLCNSVLNNLNTKKHLTSTKVEHAVPKVFVRSGYYSNGAIHLDIVNKASAKSMTFDGNIATTEVANRFNMTTSVNLSGNLYETITIETGSLFDIGLSLSTLESNQKDALYLADGPWGLDYLTDYATVDSFSVDNSPINYADDLYEVERQPSVTGLVKGNINLFRHLLPGDQTLSVTGFNSIQFKIANSEAVEIILMPANLTDWNNRLRYTIHANDTETFYSISFDDFVNASGLSESISNIKTVVFSVIGDYTTYKPYSMAINSMAFKNMVSLEVNKVEIVERKTLKNYPNPFKTHTTIKLNTPSSYVDIQLVDMLGRTVDMQHIKTSGNQVAYTAPDVTQGIYKYVLKDDLGKMHSGTFVIE